MATWRLRCIPSDGGNGIFCDGSISVVVVFEYTGSGPPTGTQVEAIGYDDSVVTVDPTVAQTTQHAECNFRISCTGKHCGEAFSVTFHAFDAEDAIFTGSCKKPVKDHEFIPAVRVTVDVGSQQTVKFGPATRNTNCI